LAAAALPASAVRASRAVLMWRWAAPREVIRCACAMALDAASSEVHAASAAAGRRAARDAAAEELLVHERTSSSADAICERRA